MKNNFKTIDDAICAYLDKINGRTTHNRGYNYWAASSLGKCKRNQVLCRAQVTTSGKTNYAWKNAAADGHSSHKWRQQALDNVGILIGEEQPIINEELCYRGHYDMIINLSGKLVLGEIKTQNNRAFKARSRLPERIDPNHKRQLGSYFYFLKHSTYPDLDSARLYYINKNTGEREEFEIYFDDAFFKSIIDELKSLNNYWKLQILPKRDPTYFCKICQFSSLCHSLPNRKDTQIKYAVQKSLSNATE